MTVSTDRPLSPELPILMGVDIGTGTVRAIAFDARGRALAEGKVPTPTHRPQRGWAEFPIQPLWEAIETAVREAVRDLPERGAVAGLAVASVGESGVLMDGDDQELEAAIAWFDERTNEELPAIVGQVGADRLTATTGLSPDPSFGLCKLSWLRRHRPDSFGRARRWLNIADWVAFRLSGGGPHRSVVGRANLSLRHQASGLVDGTDGPCRSVPGPVRTDRAQRNRVGHAAAQLCRGIRFARNHRHRRRRA